MGKNLRRGIGDWRAGMLAALLVAATVALASPGNAFAYFNWGTIGVSVGADSVSVESGSSTSVSVSLDPASMAQTLGCGMAECPDACGKGCLDENGQCTCAGPDYMTYYADVSVSSDDPGIATASYAGGVLSIAGHSAGVATITLDASLRQFTTGSTSITVSVTGSSENPDTPVAPTPDSGNGSANAGGGSDISVTPSESNTSAGEPTSTDAAASQPNVVELKSSDDRTVILVEANGPAVASDVLARIAGTNGQATFWIGESSDAPLLSWTFHGEGLDPASDLSMDLGAKLSSSAAGSLASLLSGMPDYLVAVFDQEGALPGKAEVYARCTGTYTDGASLALYRYDKAKDKLELISSGIAVSNGYASFDISQGGAYVLTTGSPANGSSTSASSPAAGTSSSTCASSAAGSQDAASKEPAAGLPIWAVALIACAAIAAIAFCVVRAKKRRAQAGDKPDSDDGAHSDGTGHPEGGL